MHSNKQQLLSLVTKSPTFGVSLNGVLEEPKQTKQQGEVNMLYCRLCALFTLVCILVLSARGTEAQSTNNPAVIADLAAKAYVWGLGPEYIERFSNYNTIVGAPFNALQYGSVPAAWNNQATNAGDASVVYISAFVDFDKAPELVLTVPPTTNQYYVVAYYDAYANTIGSIGTRTTPSDGMTSYLLVGPNSKYARKKTARIHGYDYPVMASDTTINWFLIRVLANTLIDASDPTSVPNVVNGAVQKFALNTLKQFEQNGHQPVYPDSFITPPPSKGQIEAARKYQNAPKLARKFFAQLGKAVVTNPVPTRDTGLSGTPLTDLPAWMVPQYGADQIYFVPSYGQKETLDSFAPIGLTEKGFTMPASWGPVQKAALQAGYELGQKFLLGHLDHASPGQDTNYWGFLNDLVGTYPNTPKGYEIRSIIVLEGGVANIGLDAVYPTLTGNPTELDGNHTYMLTFLPPGDPGSPAAGIFPPMVSDAQGNPKGFWSIHVYATDPTEGAAPFIAQTSVLNTHFSTADRKVFQVDPSTNTLTVEATNWGILNASTPILFGGDVSAYGLEANTVYYVASPPVANADYTYTIQVSRQWIQDLSADNVPIQGPGGHAGDVVALRAPAGAGALTYGMVKPVTQLGSTELASNLLTRNSDGSLTLWFGPTLPEGAPASNWIPTPSAAYYSTIYPGKSMRTKIQLTLRMYYPSPGSTPPSILPYSPTVPYTYIPPVVELVK
jgi:hypothetical protein